ncbi:unnamed protein product [Didymodactylos carnosus]|uniref:Uncharacterized protein n=1 Tax=Didymodactylos carnosus TaxID=1234261 RepID=A0A814PK49_9BILA|nr:unnamed protein product [Didymodactylos carnosus]CAF1152825.1 unnamed protein product [Didymodactylos carnosus]CAF3871742.1 unnamed protein product [Didymodactylos carnosus]CAF3961668.1 unnamed protein product [Didymodactylos carnosus]
MVWQQGLILKLSNLNSLCVPIMGLQNIFKTTVMADYDGHYSNEINALRSAPQNSVFGPIAHIVNTYDFPQIFRNP